MISLLEGISIAILLTIFALGYMCIGLTYDLGKHQSREIWELWVRVCKLTEDIENNRHQQYHQLWKFLTKDIPYAEPVETTQATQPNPHPTGPSPDQGQRREEKA